MTGHTTGHTTGPTAGQLEIDGGVVVGFDGSPSSEAALRWAAEDCRRRGCVLHIVRAWTVTTAPRPEGRPLSVVPGLPEFEAAVRTEVEKTVAELLGPEPGATWRVHLVHGPAGKALLAASQQADLLVVGRRGREGFVGLLLGSVSEQCARQADCPVVVVRLSP